MAQVPDKVLAWLYNVLQDYADSQRAYADIARTLSTFSTLAPRTEVHTFENGSSALLLTLSGTIPTSFRGATYQFPIKLWLPRSYPREPPFLYVVPGKDMQVRAGQHIGNDGRLYHPYLRDWPGMWDRASIVELLGFVQQTFAKEPPVAYRSQQVVDNRGPSGPSPGERSVSYSGPRVPPKQSMETSAIEMPSAQSPPPRPPKFAGDVGPQNSYSGSNGSSAHPRQDGPPLPPLPMHRAATMQYPNREPPPPANSQQRPSSSLHYQSIPDFRPQPYAQSQSHIRPQAQLTPARQSSQYQTSYDRSPVSPLQTAPADQQSSRQPSYVSSPAPVNHQNSRQPSYVTSPPPVEHQNHRQTSYIGSPPSMDARRQSSYINTPPPLDSRRQSQIIQQQWQPQRAVSYQQRPQAPKQPVQDLLSDSLEVRLPTTASHIPAPPVPTNPEKEHLLQALSATLVQQAQQKVNQNVAALAPLQTQQTALHAAQSQLERELAQLEALDAAITNNEAILRRTIQECDHTIAAAKTRQQPAIDEVLVAPTLVAQQLWNASVEEAACREAMYVLQKAVDKGRINGNDFVRQMRALGRECFLKMALSRKCAQGLGLEIG